MVVDAQCGKYNNLRLIWQRDLTCDIEEYVTQGGPSGMSEANSHTIKLFTVIIIPVRLHKMGLIQNNLCWKCNAQAGTLLHSL